MRGALDVATAVLLALAVALTFACAVGVMIMRDPYQRLHFVSPPATLSAIFVVLAVMTGGGEAQAWIKALLVAFLLMLQNGVVSHATARAAYVREKKRWPPEPRELEDAREERAE